MSVGLALLLIGSLLAAPARGWWGATLEQRERLQLADVDVCGAAWMAGLRTGDVVVSVDGAVVSNVANANTAVAKHETGKAMAVGIERAGTRSSVSVVVGTAPGPEADARIGKAAPDWKNIVRVWGSIPDHLLALRDTIVILAFWPTTCTWCRPFMKSLAATQTQHAQTVKVIGISTESERTVRDDGTMSRDYTMVVDPSAETTKAYNASRPTLFVIDRRGAVLTVLAGEMLVESRVGLLLDHCIPTL